jgi:hypothetical protein
VVLLVGLTDIDVPVPTKVFPHAPEYQRQLAFPPRLPPLTVSVTLLPEQMESTLAVMEVGEVEFTFTLMNLLSQAVVLQAPTARTK